jgi:hypothetical protein
MYFRKILKSGRITGIVATIHSSAIPKRASRSTTKSHILNVLAQTAHIWVRIFVTSQLIEPPSALAKSFSANSVILKYRKKAILSTPHLKP